MKFSNVRLLVNDFAKCFKFYTEQLGLEPAWEMQPAATPALSSRRNRRLSPFCIRLDGTCVGNADKQQPVAMREKLMVSFSVDNLDETFADLKARRDVYHRTYGYARVGGCVPYTCAIPKKT